MLWIVSSPRACIWSRSTWFLSQSAEVIGKEDKPFLAELTWLCFLLRWSLCCSQWCHCHQNLRCTVQDDLFHQEISKLKWKLCLGSLILELLIVIREICIEFSQKLRRCWWCQYGCLSLLLLTRWDKYFVILSANTKHVHLIVRRGFLWWCRSDLASLIPIW